MISFHQNVFFFYITDQNFIGNLKITWHCRKFVGKRVFVDPIFLIPYAGRCGSAKIGIITHLTQCG